MKRFFALLMVLLLSLTLCACKSKEAAAAEELIAAIGDVTLESGTAIANAELAYNALSDKDRENVENVAVLTDARAAFDSLADVQTKIKAIGAVSFESGDAIAEARSAYDGLPDALKNSISDLSALEAAEAALAEKLSLVGDWGLDVDLSTVEELGLREMLNEIAPSGDTEVPAMNLTIVLSLGEDGALSASVDKESLDAFMDALCDFTVDFVYADFAKTGFSKEQADAALQTYYGMDLRAYTKMMLEKEISIDEEFTPNEEIVCYDVDGDRLYVHAEGERDDEAYFVFTRDGDKLTLGEANGDANELLPETLLPAVLEKQ